MEVAYKVEKEPKVCRHGTVDVAGCNGRSLGLLPDRWKR